MPVYEYECERCAHVQEEVFSSYRDRASLVPCKVCGGHARFIISAPSFVMTDSDGCSVIRIDSPEKVFEGQPPELAEGARKYKRDILKKGKRISVGDS